MSAYFIANIEIRDEGEYEKYLARADEVFARFAGKYLAVDPNPEVLEGAWDCSRVVLIEFPDRAALLSWYRSEAYQEILQFRLRAARCDAVAVQG
jgi:uncharacterized protein (DUF1330 family)